MSVNICIVHNHLEIFSFALIAALRTGLDILDCSCIGSVSVSSFKSSVTTARISNGKSLIMGRFVMPSLVLIVYGLESECGL